MSLELTNATSLVLSGTKIVLDLTAYWSLREADKFRESKSFEKRAVSSAWPMAEIINFCIESGCGWLGYSSGTPNLEIWANNNWSLPTSLNNLSDRSPPCSTPWVSLMGPITSLLYFIYEDLLVSLLLIIFSELPFVPILKAFFITFCTRTLSKHDLASRKRAYRGLFNTLSK